MCNNMKNLITHTDEFDEETKEALKRECDPFDWENYCGNCDNFNDAEHCPRYGHVWPDTRWEDIGCKNFWD